MVYESDFYTTRRPYRASPAYSTYTVSSAPSRQLRILPGLGKVHVVHTYDRIVPYVGHKRLTVVTLPPKVYSTRQSVLNKEYDWIENRIRPWVGYSAVNRYLNSDSAVRYVYVRNPITGIKYHTEYDPLRYYNYYRVASRITPLSSYDYYWPYRPFSWYNSYWPVYRTLSYLDDVPVYRSLRLQRTYSPLVGSVPYGYYNYCKNYRPLSLYYNRYWPTYYDYHSYWPTYRYSSYYPGCRSLRYYDDYWPTGSYYRSYYWHKYLPLSYSYNGFSSNYADFLRSIFDDETKSIRAETASLLKRIHLPVPRIRSWPITPLNRFGDYATLPSRYSNDTYIHRLLTFSPNNKVEYATYYTEPVRKYIGHGNLACVSYAGDRGYTRRNQLANYEDPVRNDIQLLSYYINRFRQEKSQPKEAKVPLSSSRPSRIFSVQKSLDDPVAQEIRELRDARAERLAKIYAHDDKPKTDVEDALKAKKKAEEARLAEEKALVEEQARNKAQAKKDEAARKAELARQEELAAQAAAERAAELERQAELTRQEELRKQADIERAKQEEEERARLEEERRLEEEQKAEEERQQLLRLEEIARQAEEEREAELARQAEELAELARQEAELAELERQERELQEQAEKEAEATDLARQEAELAELERQEKELEELAQQEAAAAEQAKADAEVAKQEAELAELERQEAELAELERQQAELDALDAEAKALEEEATSAPEAEGVVEEEEEDVAVAEDSAADRAGEATDEEEAAVEEEEDEE